MFLSRRREIHNGHPRTSRRLGRRTIRNGVIRFRPGLEGLEDRAVPAFIAPVDYAAGAGVTSAAVGEFNGDRLKDIAPVGNLSGRGVVQVLLYSGTGTFTPAASATTG